MPFRSSCLTRRVRSAVLLRPGRPDVCTTPPRLIVAAAALTVALPLTGARSQDTPTAGQPPNAVAGDGASLDSLLARAVAVSPRMRAARARIEAAGARIGPAGARPDPMLMAGIQNLPITSAEAPTPGAPGAPMGASDAPDPMTMRMVGIGQSLPYPGKLALRRRSAERELDAARLELDATRLEVVRDVRHAYYDIAYADRALEIVERSRRVLLDVIAAAEARYAVGTGAQADVLRARVEATRLGEEAVSLIEARRAARARLNALLDLPTDAPLGHAAAIPIRIARAAVTDSAARIRFESASLGSRAADSPLPSLAALESLAVARSPMLRAHETRIAAQAARVELARKEHLPDFDVSLQYGQRSGLPDMVTATVSVPIAVRRRSKQDQLVAEARAELAALAAEHHARQNEIRAEVARLYGVLERERAQLALYVKAVLPQGRATLASVVAGYQVGRSEFLSLLDAQTTLFGYETAYFRGLTSFAKTLAELELVVGQEILP